MGKKNKEAKCSNCARCIIVQFGYSNWTVEGAEMYCSKKKNPDMPFDRWYGADKRDKFAKKCPKFISGDPVTIDVDKDEADSKQDYRSKKYWKPYATVYVSAKKIMEVT